MQNSEGCGAMNDEEKIAKGKEKVKNNKVWGTVTDKEDEGRGWSSFTGTRPSLFLIVHISLSFNVIHPLVPRPLHWSSSLTASSFTVHRPPLILPFLFCYSSFSVLPQSKFLVLYCPLSFNVISSSLFHFFHCMLLVLHALFLSIAVPCTLMLLNLQCSSSCTVPHPSLFLILHRFSSLLLLFSSHLLV